MSWRDLVARRLNEADQKQRSMKGTGMSHDAASVVGQMAGLTESEPAKPDVTPAQLIEAFCSPELAGDLVAQAGTTEENGATVSRGFCGYNGRRGDSLLTGFDDGYDFMGYLEEHGWRAAAAKGDWPYVVYMTYTKREPYAIAEYCEADFTLWAFKSGEAAQAFYKGLKDCP